MPKETIPFSSFLEAAGEENKEFVTAMNDYLLENGCKLEIKEAKNGYVVSYIFTADKKTVFNYIFRKKGMLVRVYAIHIGAYMEITDGWPKSMKSEVKKAGPCKRMLNPDACNPKCAQGFDFIMDGERQQKCRYGLQFFVDEESKPFLREFIEKEIEARRG